MILQVFSPQMTLQCISFGDSSEENVIILSAFGWLRSEYCDVLVVGRFLFLFLFVCFLLAKCPKPIMIINFVQ